MTRRPRVSEKATALALTALAGCGARGPSFATAAELPPPDRSPAGVVVDPAFSPPHTQGRAEASAGVAALEPPLPGRLATRTVDAFFGALVKKDMNRLAAVVTPDAVSTGRLRGGAASLLELWRVRMASLRYDLLATERLYRTGDVETYAYEDLELAEPRRPVRPAEMQPGDLLVKVPMAVVRAGSDRVFGDELAFVLRRSGAQYKIRAILEDFQMP